MYVQHLVYCEDAFAYYAFHFAPLPELCAGNYHARIAVLYYHLDYGISSETYIAIFHKRSTN
jgi:hypothetical protein